MDQDQNEIEALLIETEAEEWEKEKALRKRRRKWMAKPISSLLVFALLITTLSMWFDVFNLPAIEFVKVSNRLSKNPDVRQYKKAVVTIEGNGVKGTGFSIAKDGLIVTNAHVTEGSNLVDVHFNNGKTYQGKVIASKTDVDLALIKIKAKNIPVLKLAEDPDWEKWDGQKIIFIGNPLGFTQIANEGTLMGKSLVNGMDIPIMVIKAPIYKGNSGSPVLNKQGKVIGVIFATLQNPGLKTKQIIGAAIPAYYLKTIFNQKK
jgi:serine protease Do